MTIIDSIYMCYDQSHHPFSSKGPTIVDQVDWSRPASKIIRAVLRSLIHPESIDEEATKHTLHKCHCASPKGRGQRNAYNQDIPLKQDATLEELGIKTGQPFFIRRIAEIPQIPPRPRASSSKRQIEDQDSIPGSSTPNGPPSKRSKRGPQVKEDVSSVTEDISTLLGGTQWKNQAIGDFGPIKQLSLSSLKALRKATEKSLKLIDKPRKKRELGCLPIVLIEAVVEAFNERLRDNSTIGRAAHLTLSSVDYVLACEILDKKIRQRSAAENGEEEIENVDQSKQASEQFPQAGSDLRAT